jgi:hypothetical protein
MADDDSFYLPHRKPIPPRGARPGELLFTFLQGNPTIVCELRYHGEFGVEAFFVDGTDRFYSRMFQTRALAIQWAEIEKEYI